MKTISIANRKGGIGKTTLAVNISYELSRLGYQVVIVDLDGQCDLTRIYYPGISTDEDDIWDLLTQRCDIEDCIYEVYENLYLIPGSKNIVHLSNTDENILKNQIDRLENFLIYEKNIDFVIFDHPPNINEAALLGFVASEEVLIVLEPESLCVHNIGDLLSDLESIKREMNPNLHILGMVINRVDMRRNLTEKMVETIRATFREELFDTYISNNTAIPTSLHEGVPVRKLKWRGRSIRQFSSLTDEIIERVIGNGDE